MAIDKLEIAANVLETLNKTVFCNGVYYFFSNGYYQELSDFDIAKLIRNFFLKNGFSSSWSKSISGDILAAIKIQIAEDGEVDIMDDYESFIPISNGIVNLSDLNKIHVMPHSSKYLFTYKLPVEWKHEKNYGEPEHFLKFLNTTFTDDDNNPNQDTIEMILYIFAYIIYPSITMEKMFMFLGNGANGKSLLISIMALFFKPDHITYASLQTLSEDQSNNRDFLLRSRLNIAGEQKGIKIDPEELKKIASGQALQIILRYKGNFSFKPKTKLIVDSNNLPFFSDNTLGTKRRLCIVNFDNTFLEEDDYLEQQRILSGQASKEEYKHFDLAPFGIYRQKNNQEMVAAIKGEINEIFNLLILYIHKLKERKWQLPKNKEALKAMAEYEEGTDFVKVWLLRTFEVPEKGAVGVMPISMTSIFEKFHQDYVSEFGQEPRFKKNTISKRIGELFHDKGKRVAEKDAYSGEMKRDVIFNLVKRIKVDL